jgi:hypothetical protein
VNLSPRAQARNPKTWTSNLLQRPRSKGARPSPRALRVCPVTRRPARAAFPLRRFQPSPAVASRGLPLRCASLSWRFGAPRSLLCAGIAGSSGSPLPPRPRIFIRARAVLSLRRPPHLPMRFHPPSSLAASFRVLRPARCPSCLVEPRDPTDRPKSASLGVLSLIAASAAGVHHSAGNPDPAVTFRPRRFSRPRRFAPPAAFAGLFHPAATSRVCPSGVCPSWRSRTGFPRPIHALLALGAPACHQRMRPRLQGLAPRLECGVFRNGLGPDRSAPLVGFLLLRVLPPGNVGMPSHPLRPRPSPARNPSRLVPGVFPLPGLACLGSGCRPARAFWPEPPSLLSKSRVRGRVSGDPPSRRTRGDIEHCACQLRGRVTT